MSKFLDTYSIFLTENGGVKVIDSYKIYYGDYYHLNDRGAKLLVDKVLAEKIEATLDLE